MMPRQPSVPNFTTVFKSFIVSQHVTTGIATKQNVILALTVVKGKDLLAYGAQTVLQIRSVLPAFLSSFTTRPTSCELLRVVTRIASSVSTTTISFTPTSATVLPGENT